ncbi:hypothetical protein Tco_0672450 [Tanacetum coccineum]
MNTRCSALLQNHLPPNEQDPGSFILPCSIGKLDFNNVLADLGASINVMPLSMYKSLGIGNLKPINMIFFILDMVEDLRMPIVLGRPLLATTHTKVDIFRKSISLEVGSEKVIFKMRSSFTTTFESVRSIRSDTCPEDDDFKKTDYDLFSYDSESYEFNRLLSVDPDIFSYKFDVQESYEEIVYRITEEKQSRPKERRVHWCRANLKEKENGSEYCPSYDPNHDVCDGGDSSINKVKCY